MPIKKPSQIAQYLLYGLAIALMACIVGAGMLHIYNAFNQHVSTYRRSMNASAYEAQLFFDQREVFLRGLAASAYSTPSGANCYSDFWNTRLLEEPSGVDWCIVLTDREQAILDLNDSHVMFVSADPEQNRYLGVKQGTLSAADSRELSQFVAQASEQAQMSGEGGLRWYFVGGNTDKRFIMLAPLWQNRPQSGWLALEVGSLDRFLRSPNGRVNIPNYALLNPNLQVIAKNGVFLDKPVDLSQRLQDTEDAFHISWLSYRPDYLYFNKRVGADHWRMLFYIRFKDVLQNGDLPIYSTSLVVLFFCLLVVAVVRQIRHRLLLPALQQHKALLENEQLTRSIVETAPVGLCLLDQQGGSIVSNQMADAWLLEEDPEFILQMANSPSSVSSTRQLSNGQSVQLEATAMMYHDEPVILCTVQNITELKHIEQSLRIEKQKADAASQTKSEFLATMSHEIRTPLFGIMGTVELLGLTELTARQRGYLSTVRQSSDLLLHTINETLTLSSTESGQAKLDVDQFSPVDLINSVVSTYADRARLKGVLLYGVVSPSAPLAVLGDEVRIRQILNNLVNNAVKFTVGGHVVLRLSVEAQNTQSCRLKFQVSDTGIGMDTEVRDRLFSAYQVRNTGQDSNLPAGSGLGLFICKRLADMMQGELSVVSSLGLGTSISLDLTLAVYAKPAPEPLRPTRVFVTGAVCEIVQNLCGWLRRVGMQATPYQPGDEKQSEGALLLQAWPQGDRISGWQGQVITMLPPGQISEEPSDEEAICLNAYDLRQLYQTLRHQQAQTVEVVAQSPEQQPWLRTGLRLLVVDDNEINREILAEQLQHLGCEYVLANDGRQAWELVQNDNFDAILTDLNMPIMNGLELTRRLREQGCMIPIYGVTANAVDQEHANAQAAGMNELLPRPLSMSVLADLLRRSTQ